MAAAVAGTLVFGGGAVASAAPAPSAVVTAVPAAVSAKLTIGSITSPVARPGGKAYISPSVITSGNVKVESKRLTVKQGSKTLARNQTRALLSPGSYSVTTTITYKTFTLTNGVRTYSKVQSATRTQKLNVRTAVALKTIAGKTAPYGGKATITPSVSATKGVSVTSKTVTVKQGTKTIVANKTSASLRAGTYKATTTVKYRIPLYKTVNGRTTSTLSTVYTATKTQNLTIKAGKRPSQAAPYSNGECPSWAPIKGNGNSGIYHVPGGAYYNATNAEECFTTEPAALNAGYRKSKR
jgi:hypothetical protein